MAEVDERVSPRTEDRAFCRHRVIKGDDVDRAWKCARCGEPFVKAEATALYGAELVAKVRQVRGWLDDPGWPQFGPGIGRDPFDPGREAARATAQQVLDQFAALIGGADHAD